MKLNLIIALLIGLSTALTAQVQFGVKTSYAVNYNEGTSQEFVNLSPLRIHNISVLKSSAKKGLGISIYAQNEKLYFMTDAQYVSNGRNFSLLSNDYNRTALDPATSLETNETDFRVGINGGVKVGNFKFGVGPELSYSLEMTETLSDIEEITVTDQRIKGGFNFLIGYEFFDHIHLDLKHTYMFDDVTSDFTYLGSDMNFKANRRFLELTLGLYF